MIQRTASFIRYFEGIRRRTLTFAKAIPADRIGWAPQEGEFNCGEILLHVAGIESITVRVMLDGKWASYPGHERSQSSNLETIVAYLEAAHAKSMEQLAALSDSELSQPRPAINGRPVKAWQLLMAMVEHEVHHRSQLAGYLLLLGVEPPQLFGLKVEDVIASTGSTE